MDVLQLKPNVSRIQRDIKALAKFRDDSKPGWTRRPFTLWYNQSRDWLKSEMRSIGMSVKLDAASNLIGTIPGSDPSLSPIMIGSHTDTVTGGGRFDGIIGVLAGLEIARIIKEEKIKLNHTLEVVDFTAEEPSDFGISTIGSRGMVNNLTDKMLNRKNGNGNILSEEIRRIGGQPELIIDQARKKGDISLYLELHIEQGPILEHTKNKLGVVTGIVGIHRYSVTVEGAPNHAGTTPMDLRYDALAGSSELILFLESTCNEKYKYPVVGTIGKLNVKPNSSNVIPGKVEFELEVRSLDIKQIEEVMERFKRFSNEISEKRGLSITLDFLSKSSPVHIDNRIMAGIKQVCQQTADTITLPSGAGHDANQLANIGPIGMIFVQSIGGKSHCPEEWTPYEDVALGVEALARSLMYFDNKKELLTELRKF